MFFVWILIMLGLVAVDQISKLLVLNYLNPEEPFILWDGVFRFSYVENRGAAFGMLSDHRWVFMVVSVIAIAALLIYLWKWPPQSKLACFAISMVAGGGIGNMIDRVRLGFVVDFLDFYLFPNLWKWVFNLADAFVCVGGGLLLLWCLLDIIRETKDKKAEKRAQVEDSAYGADNREEQQNASEMREHDFEAKSENIRR